MYIYQSSVKYIPNIQYGQGSSEPASDYTSLMSLTHIVVVPIPPEGPFFMFVVY